MATKIYSNGTAQVTVAVNEKIAIYSEAPLKLYKQVGYPNQPSAWVLVYTTAAGEQYVSAALSATVATIVRVDAGPSAGYYNTGSAPTVTTPQADITGADATFTITGLSDTQGGYAKVVGGTSSTSANAGGEAGVLGGQAGATGVGGAATVTGAAGGATSGVGGAASVIAGAGTAGNSAGGIGKVVGGAGQGSAAGGAAQVTGGVGGATGAGGAVTVVAGAGGATSGIGGAVTITAGAGTNGNASGGTVAIAAGAKNGSGLNGVIYLRSPVSRKVTVPAMTDTATIATADILQGTIKCTPTAAATYTMPTGAVMAAILPADFTTGDSLDFSLVNVATNDTYDITVASAASGTTMYGCLVVEANSATTKISSGIFRLVCSGASTYDIYRVS